MDWQSYFKRIQPCRNIINSSYFLAMCLRQDCTFSNVLLTNTSSKSSFQSPFEIWPCTFEFHRYCAFLYTNFYTFLRRPLVFLLHLRFLRMEHLQETQTTTSDCPPLFQTLRLLTTWRRLSLCTKIWKKSLADEFCTSFFTQMSCTFKTVEGNVKGLTLSFLCAFYLEQDETLQGREQRSF